MTPVGMIVLILIVVGILVVVLRGALGKGRRAIDRRVEDVVTRTSGYDATMAQDLGSEVIAAKRAERFKVLADLFRGKTFFRKIEFSLISAGIPLKPAEFMGIVIFSTIVMALLGILIGKKLVLALLFIVLGYKLPFIVLNFLKGRRVRTLEAQLSDSLTMIASGLKAGYGFLQGIAAAGNQMPPPISDEFRRVVRSAQLGMEMRDALQRMGERIQSYDFDMAITACCVQLQTGGNLSELLETISQTIRERIKLRREISAATAQGRMSGGMLMLLPVGIAVALRFINRDYVMLLFDTDLGKKMIYLAIGMQMFGCWIINKLLQFEG